MYTISLFSSKGHCSSPNSVRGRRSRIKEAKDKDFHFRLMTAQRKIPLHWDSKQSTGLYYEEPRMDDVKNKRKLEIRLRGQHHLLLLLQRTTLNFRNPHGGSSASIIPIPQEPMPSSDFTKHALGAQTYV